MNPLPRVSGYEEDRSRPYRTTVSWLDCVGARMLNRAREDMTANNPSSMFRVFLSSTWLDLQRERKAAEDCLHRLRETKHVGMEYFGSRNETPRETSLAEVDDCQLYVGIFGGRYGTGITEAEYLRARELNLDCLIYFKDERLITKARRDLSAAKRLKQARLKKRLRRDHVVSVFTSSDNLAAQLTADLHKWLAKHPALAGKSFQAIHQLPSLTEHFTGRTAELKTLCKGIRQRAKEGKPTAIVSAIEGLGGVGKTELAVAVAYELAGDFPEAQIVLQLAAHSTSPATPAQVRDELLSKVHPDKKLPEDDRELWELYQKIFRDDNGQPRRMLVILDDVADDDQVRALMPPRGCAVLITSRRALESGESLHLTTFPRAEAIALLRSFRADLTEADAGAVAELCGFLAIALQAAGGFLKRHASKPATEYIAELRGDPLNRLHHTDAQFDVNGVFERSLRDMTAPQRAAFHRLSVMASGFDREAALAVAGSKGDDLDELVALNLLEFHPPTQRFDWHDLLRAFAAKGLKPKEELAARMSHACHFTAVGDRAEELYLAGGGKTLDGLALFDRERRHIEAAFEFLHSCSRRREEAESEPSASVRRLTSAATKEAACRQLVALVNAVVYTGGLRFHPRDQRIPWLETQLAAAREIGDRQNEGAALGNLGNAYDDLSDARKAIEYHELWLVIAREIGDRRGEGNALGNLGLAYADLGDVRKAIEFYEQHRVIAREIGDRRGEGQ
ncbi:MAG: DUF4062 domain-containing protein, partial [Verrucomicrobia bacterium]|nr:DUF4062 domain-containing protein [Verrucomicrobiota bacterium]